MKLEGEFEIYTDGGSRGNPGEAAYGFVVFHNGTKIYEEGRKLGIQTNNFAEYTGIIEALRYFEKKLETKEQTGDTNKLILQFKMDSMLACEQLSGRWRIKNEGLRSLYYTIKELEKNLGAQIKYSHVRREFNKEADRMVNLALDGEIN